MGIFQTNQFLSKYDDMDSVMEYLKGGEEEQNERKCKQHRIEESDPCDDTNGRHRKKRKITKALVGMKTTKKEEDSYLFPYSESCKKVASYINFFVSVVDIILSNVYESHPQRPQRSTI